MSVGVARWRGSFESTKGGVVTDSAHVVLLGVEGVDTEDLGKGVGELGTCSSKCDSTSQEDLDDGVEVCALRTGGEGEVVRRVRASPADGADDGTSEGLHLLVGEGVGFASVLGFGKDTASHNLGFGVIGGGHSLGFGAGGAGFLESELCGSVVPVEGETQMGSEVPTVSGNTDV